MAEPVSKQTTLVQDWPGLVSNSGPMTGRNPPGAAAEQVNLRVNVPGELAARPGYRKVEFDNS